MNQTPAEEQILEALGKLPMFARLDDKSRRKLARLCTHKSFDAGDVLYEEGAMALGLFLVTSGQIEVTKGSGKKKVVIETVGTGGIVGQLALLDDRPRAASAEALEPTECLLLTRDSYETLVKKDPQIAWCLTPGLAARFRELQSLAMEAKLAQHQSAAPAEEAESDAAGTKKTEKKKTGQKKVKAEKAEEAAADEEDEDDDETSDIESALFKMMRMQFGIMAGTAKGMTEMAKAMETFLDSMADETDFKTKDDWGDLMSKIPDAMVTASRAAMDDCEKVPEEMVDAYRRYCDAED